MYDPMSGVFLQKDPFSGVMNRVMSMNGYSYVEGNPINAVDLAGTCPTDPWWNDFPGKRCVHLAESISAHPEWGFPLETLMDMTYGDLEFLMASMTTAEVGSNIHGAGVEALETFGWAAEKGVTAVRQTALKFGSFCKREAF